MRPPKQRVAGKEKGYEHTQDALDQALESEVKAAAKAAEKGAATAGSAMASVTKQELLADGRSRQRNAPSATKSSITRRRKALGHRLPPAAGRAGPVHEKSEEYWRRHRSAVKRTALQLIGMAVLAALLLVLLAVVVGACACSLPGSGAS